MRLLSREICVSWFFHVEKLIERHLECTMASNRSLMKRRVMHKINLNRYHFKLNINTCRHEDKTFSSISFKCKIFAQLYLQFQEKSIAPETINYANICFSFWGR